MLDYFTNGSMRDIIVTQYRTSNCLAPFFKNGAASLEVWGRFVLRILIDEEILLKGSAGSETISVHCNVSFALPGGIDRVYSLISSLAPGSLIYTGKFQQDIKE
jgi:hypothetical protein